MTNDDALSSLAADALGDPELQAALADREAQQVAQELGDVDAIDFGVPGAAEHVSARAYALIVQHETGGRAYYEQVYKSRPVWPTGSSGITIGFGYDLGYIGLAEFQRDWGGLEGAIQARLLLYLGRHGGTVPDSALTAGAAALADIRIAWDAAETVFKAATLPKFAGLTSRSLPRCDEVPDDCFGALVSLTFNRGASYSVPFHPDTDSLDRYREMRAIYAAMDAQRFAEVPGLMRAMKRIWAGKAIEAEMSKRRDDEADLFRDGLAELQVASH